MRDGAVGDARRASWRRCPIYAAGLDSGHVPRERLMRRCKIEQRMWGRGAIKGHAPRFRHRAARAKRHVLGRDTATEVMNVPGPLLVLAAAVVATVVILSAVLIVRRIGLVRAARQSEVSPARSSTRLATVHPSQPLDARLLKER